MKPYKIKLEESKLIPALDNCFFVIESIEIFPLSKIVHYHGYMYELEGIRLIRKPNKQTIQMSQKIDGIFDAE